MKLLTQKDVAKMLNKSEDHVKRLRLAGKIPFIPGRPVLMDETDVLNYLKRAKQWNHNLARTITATTKSSIMTRNRNMSEDKAFVQKMRLKRTTASRSG
tara:strand:- start:9 stop:305 length:297 start_codon:yes stop_codon:yes gene_type:complete